MPTNPQGSAAYDRLVQIIDGALNATRHIALDDRGAFFRPARRYPNPTLLATEVAQAICDSGMVPNGT